jgi:hypothetical protein
METLIIHAEQDKLDKVIDFLKSIKVSYEINKGKVKKEKPYNPDFVKKVLDAKKEEGEKEIDPNDPWKSLGLL